MPRTTLHEKQEFRHAVFCVCVVVVNHLGRLCSHVPTGSCEGFSTPNHGQGNGSDISRWYGEAGGAHDRRGVAHTTPLRIHPYRSDTRDEGLR